MVRINCSLRLIGMLGLLLVVSASRFAAQGAAVVITSAAPDVNQTILFINGVNFAAGATAFLAGSQIFGVVVAASGESMIAQLPQAMPPGSYLLQVTNGPAPGQSAAFVVTLGDAGPQGLQGVQGLQGLQGPQGPQGPAAGPGTITSAQLASGLTLGGTTSGNFSGRLTGNVSGGAATFSSVGIGTTMPAFALEVAGTGAGATIGINGTPIAYLPDQIPFFGSMALGNGLRGLSNTMSEEGRYNTSVGMGALFANTTGYFNTAVGWGALTTNTTGVYSVAIGQGSLHDNTTGVNNTAVGVSALYSNTTANYNTGIGVDALEYNTTGTENTAVGKRSNWQNVTGSQNTSVGVDTLYSNVDGSSNMALGSNALYANTASNNVAVGQAALTSNTTGTENTAVGRATLLNTTTGSYNVAIGNLAGRYQADGNTPLTSADNSVYIGYQSRGLNNSDFNSIVIGSNARGLGANTVVLGNSDIRITALNGSVGIGTTAPASALEVNGTADAKVYKVGGVIGVSCSGLPTAGFTVVNGIVTRC